MLSRMCVAAWICLGLMGCAESASPAQDTGGLSGNDATPPATDTTLQPVAGTTAGDPGGSTPPGVATGAAGMGGNTGAGQSAGDGDSTDTAGTTSDGSPVGDAGDGGGDGDGDGDGSGDGDVAGDGDADDRPPCLDSDSEGVIIGDSFINWSTHTFPADLAREAGQTWRQYAIGGASMASGGIATLVPDQFEQAVLADPNIKVVVMDGGGNDIMIPAATWPGGADCKNRADAPSIQVCVDIIDFAVDAAKEGMNRMAEVGVSDVLYFFYPEVPEGTPLGGLAPNAMLAYGRMIAKEVCDNAVTLTGGQLTCHFVDMVPVFEGHNPEWFYPTDIHPNPQGSAAMAKAVWERMQSECIGQKASSGCCKP